MTARSEQETTVTAGRDDGVVYIYTSNVVHLRKLRKDDRCTEIQGGEEWGQFTVPADAFSPLSGFKRRYSMTAEQRQAAADRLRHLREEQGR